MDGPCLLIEWRDGDKLAILQSRYFPPDDMPTHAAEEFAVDWLADRRAVVVRLRWAWGDVPAGVSRRKLDL